MYRVLFWDFDGTLVDTAEGVINSIEYALRKMGVEVPERSKMTKYMGPPLIQSFADFFDNEEDIKKAVALYRERYSDIGWAESKPFDGIPETLRKLKDMGYINAMATSKPEHYAHMIAKKLGFFDLIEYPCGATTDGRRTHKNEVVKYALETTGIEIGEDGKIVDDTAVLMIGDRFYDVEGAGEFGVKTLGVTYGYGSKEELLTAGAMDTVATPEEVIEYLTSR